MSQTDHKPDAPQRPASEQVRASLLWVWHALSRNLLLKLLALFLAVLLWSVLIASDGSLTREKTFQNVEVTVSGQDTLKTRGLIVMEDVAALVPSVRIRAEVTQANYDRATGTNYGPRIDLTRLRQEGVQQAPVIMTSTSYGQVLEVDPPYVEVTVERYIQRSRIPVVVESGGVLQNGLWADTPRVDPVQVAVSGPASLADRVVRAVAYFDQGVLTGTRVPERNAVRFRLEDAEGNELDSPLLQVTNEGVILDTVVVEVACYPVKQLPIDLRSAVEGAPAEGYVLTGILAEPDGVWVAASQATLRELARAFVENPLKLDGLDATKSATLRLRRITDAKHLGVDEVLLTAVIEETVIARSFRGLAVEATGVPEGYAVKLARAKMNAVVTGGYHWVRGLADSDVRLYADVAGLAPGTHEVLVQASADNAVSFSCAPEYERVTVTLTAPEN